MGCSCSDNLPQENIETYNSLSDNTGKNAPLISGPIDKNSSSNKPLKYKGSMGKINNQESDYNLFINKKSLVGNFVEKIETVYKFVKELGEGAFGKVYLVEHRTTAERFACKRISKKKVKDREVLTQEINLMIDLDHPNIVKLFEVFEDKTYIFLIMEMLKGGELFDRILSRAKSNNYYTEKEIVRIYKQVVSGISFIHSNNVCHRDIKPENIIFADEKEESSIKIIDFGLSKIFDRKSNMTSQIGTCFYMSPEVIAGNYNEKCDVWALGVLLYILVCGRPPFAGANDKETMKKISKGKFEFKWEGWENISTDCKDLITQILDVNVDKRPSADDILANKWIMLEAPKSTEIPININLDDLKKFGQTNKLGKAVSQFIAYRLSDSNIKDLNLMFQSIDSNGNGSISIEEFKTGVETFIKKNNIKIVVDELDNYFKAIDLDKNGVITYNEFITATFERKLNMTKEMVYQAFKTFDIDHDGGISFAEFENVIQAKTEEDKIELKKLWDKIDKNKNGIIDFEELMANLDI